MGRSWREEGLASQASPPIAALGMFAFGFGTAPALLAVGGARRFLPALSGPATRWAVAVALVAFGLFTALRGGAPALGLEPSCCAAPALDS